MADFEVRVTKALDAKLQRINEEIEEAVELKLTDIATHIVHFSPVDTGAFVNSWSFKDNPGGGRAKSSHGKPKGQNKENERGRSLNNLANDIRRTFDTGSTGGSLRSNLTVTAGEYYFLNGAPHADKVETKYGIKAQIRNIYG